MEESKNKEIQAVRDELMEKGDNLKQYKSKSSVINQVHYQVITAHIHFNKKRQTKQIFAILTIYASLNEKVKKKR